MSRQEQVHLGKKKKEKEKWMVSHEKLLKQACECYKSFPKT